MRSGCPVYSAPNSLHIAPSTFGANISVDSRTLRMYGLTHLDDSHRSELAPVKGCFRDCTYDEFQAEKNASAADRPDA